MERENVTCYIKSLDWVDMAEIIQADLNMYSIDKFCDMVKSYLNDEASVHPEYDDYSVKLHHRYGTAFIELYGVRLETDMEYNERIEKQQNLRECELRELKRLLDKYGDQEL